MVDSVTMKYFLDPDTSGRKQRAGSANVIADYDGSDTLVATYVTPGPPRRVNLDNNVSQTRSGSTYYYMKDGLGSVRNLVDSSEAAQNTYDYYAFGKELGTWTQNIANRYTYTAREYDSESKQYYYRARYYGCAERFTTRDHGLTGLNHYVYGASCPSMNSDPTGFELVPTNEQYFSNSNLNTADLDCPHHEGCTVTGVEIVESGKPKIWLGGLSTYEGPFSPKSKFPDENNPQLGEYAGYYKKKDGFRNFGYMFHWIEMRVKVEGNPNKCRYTQFAKSTRWRYISATKTWEPYRWHLDNKAYAFDGGQYGPDVGKDKPAAKPRPTGVESSCCARTVYWGDAPGWSNHDGTVDKYDKHRMSISIMVGTQDSKDGQYTAVKWWPAWDKTMEQPASYGKD